MQNTSFNILKMISIHAILVYAFAGEVVWGRLYILLAGFILAWFFSGKKAWTMRAGFAFTLSFCVGNAVTTTFWGLPFSINFLASASGKATILSEFIARLPYLRFGKIFLTFGILVLLFSLLQKTLEKNMWSKIFHHQNKKSDITLLS